MSDSWTEIRAGSVTAHPPKSRSTSIASTAAPATRRGDRLSWIPARRRRRACRAWRGRAGRRFTSPCREPVVPLSNLSIRQRFQSIRCLPVALSSLTIPNRFGIQYFSGGIKSFPAMTHHPLLSALSSRSHSEPTTTDSRGWYSRRVVLQNGQHQGLGLGPRLSFSCARRRRVGELE